MAALTNTAPFKPAAQSCCRRPHASQRMALVCRAQAQEQGWQKNLGLHLLAAGLAATALVSTPSIAEAGVIYEQPKSKKVFQGAGKKAAPPPTESSSGGGGGGLSLPSVGLPSISLPSVGLPSLPGPDLSGLNAAPGDFLDPRKIALPGAIVGIGAAGFAAFTLDSGFREMMREGLVKDSTTYAGYEEAVDEYASGLKKGTKKISKAAGKAKGKAKGAAKGTGLGGFFGKK